MRRSFAAPRLRLDEEGFSILSEDRADIVIRWSEVEAVIAYKLDLFAYDEIRVAFETPNPRAALVEISEEWVGFKEVVARMGHEYGIAPSWWSEVAFPAFARNERVLFRRGDSTASSGGNVDPS